MSRLLKIFFYIGLITISCALYIKKSVAQSPPPTNPPSDTASAGGCILDNPTSNRNPANTFGDKRGRTNGYAHQGIDIMIKENSEENGQHGCNVIMNGDSPLFGEKACMPPAKSGYGLYTRFECGNGVAEVRYTHLNGCNPSNGKFLVGRTGNACPTPPHIHYEILLKNPADGKFYRIDPACAWTSGRPVGGKCPLPRPPNVCIEANRIKLIQDGIAKGGQVSSKSVPKGKPQSEAVMGSRYCNGQGIPADTTGQDASEQSGPADEAMGNEPGPDNMTETITTEKELNESKCETCSCPCSQPIVDDHNKRAGLHGIRPYFDQCDGKGQDCEKPANEGEESALKTHRDWMVQTFFLKQILPAMMLMTNQMTTVAIQQTAMVGSMLDAKHQLETQRLFQQMQAKAHKDYHPSEGMCEIGTNSRALATSDRRADLAHVTLSQRMMSRALITGVTTTVKGPSSDIESRIDEFKKTYCNKGDNGGGLQNVCAGSGDKKRINKDVDFTRTLDLPLTINADFTKDSGAVEPDAQDIFALSANLYGHTATPLIKRELLANDKGLINRDAGDKYLDLRAIAAKRSVAQNSFSAIAGMKNTGGTEAAEMAPFIKKLVEELGVPTNEIDDYLGKEPSYFAQMEVLTKKIYQNPVFFTELYDKPVNVQRKSTAIEAINLMQDRDIYRSILRSEAMSAVILETMLIREQERVTNEVNRLTQGESR
ncbi:MAG: hypothetical protein J0L77_01615 [Alphaproteobacteria bacterium]|nr:hypothetical protein [Alphaproteobacteria bacterium]